MQLPAPLLGIGLMTSLAIAAVTAPSPELFDLPEEGRFVYLRSGAPVLLQASPLYSATLVSQTTGHKEPLTPPDGLELDPRGDRVDLIERGVTLFRVPYSVTPRGLETVKPPDAWQAALGANLPAQPVFEHGAALRIPSDEVFVGFAPATTLEDAKRLLAGSWDDLDAVRLRKLRPGCFVCVLREASFGRAFGASRLLTQVDGVLWAEPSFINIHLETPGDPPDGRSLLSLPTSRIHQQKLESVFLSRLISAADRDPEGDAWQVMIDGHFENDVDKWLVARDEGSNRILPVVVRERTHGGKRAVYMTGKGLAGNTPPDPYLEGAGSYLISPTFNLAAYREVYIELWFWAKFEDPDDAPRRVHDFGRVLLFDMASEVYVYEYPIVPVGTKGDLTRDPGTYRGWRKLMFRVPAEKLKSPLQVHVHFFSDGLGAADGMFVDDVRVIFRANPDVGATFSHAPDAVQQYAIVPRGQIAGWPASADPRTDAAAAWLNGIPEQRAIVALLDDGVERDHPDLAFWEPAGEKNGDPEAEQELFPGEPVDPGDRHGTACAGVLGAVARNDIGIAGVAPGALLLPLIRGVDDVSIVTAIDAAIEYGADVLVIPWGFNGAAPEAITQAILDAIDAGMVVVTAAGDGVHRPYSDSVDYPCMLSASTPLICVGASSIAGEPKGAASADGIYWWRSAEDHTGPDLLAPGSWLHATDRRGPLGYNAGAQNVSSDWTDEFAGTGASACYVGGVATLMLSHDPLLPPERLKQLITSTATPLPSSNGTRRVSHLVVPRAAVQASIESAAARARNGELLETGSQEDPLPNLSPDL